MADAVVTLAPRIGPSPGVTAGALPPAAGFPGLGRRGGVSRTRGIGADGWPGYRSGGGASHCGHGAVPPRLGGQSGSTRLRGPAMSPG